jgi:hypothetical protein
MPKSDNNKILGFDFSFSSAKGIVKTGNDVHTTKSRTQVILFSKKYWRILGRSELVDFFHIQYTDLMSHSRHSKTCTVWYGEKNIFKLCLNRVL